MSLTDQKVSPMMAQWYQCKKDANEALLLFRLGDFYEAFHDDAKTLADELELTLTQRQGIPMSGIPSQTLEKAIEKLVSRGRLVAVAEQIGNPQEKGIVKREVVKTYSPATYVLKETGSANNFFVAICQVNSILGLALLDLSTGELNVCEIENQKDLLDEIYRRSPRELLVSKQFYAANKSFFSEIKLHINCRITLKEKWHFDHQTTYNFLTAHFNLHSLDTFGLKGQVSAINAAGALMIHVHEELYQTIDHIKAISKESLKEYMALDLATQKHLDIFPTANRSSPSLLSHLDKTLTPMGKRLIKTWVIHPLLDLEAIKKRQEAISDLLNRTHEQELLYKHLSQMKDLERLATRAKTGTATPKDLAILRDSLVTLPHLKNITTSLQAAFFNTQSKSLVDLSGLTKRLFSSLTEDPPLRLSEGRVFKKGFCPHLDELLDFMQNGKNWLINYQNRLREETGIKTLKVSYNRAFGYYIEVSRVQAKAMPASFDKRQTLVNTERFISNELKEYEYKVLTAEEQLKKLEVEKFGNLLEEVASYAPDILSIANAIAQIDCIFSLTQVAKLPGYCCPLMDHSKSLDIREGRHPLIESQHAISDFIPNDTTIGSPDALLFLITGPNMAGKSTYIRQVAILAIMAQIGSYIPASSAKVGIIDKVLSRIGANDDLLRGQSTFMVEMIETANILHGATDRSLVVLDEIGRGTSTYDGISIAWAVAEHLLTKTKPKTLFATHYWELTELEKKLPGAINYQVAVKESEQGITFLHKIIKGGADKSYGIHVARLAGIPSPVLIKAKEMLHLLETTKREKPKTKSDQLFLFDKPSCETKIIKEIQTLDPNRITPLEALEKLMKWSKDVRS